MNYQNELNIILILKCRKCVSIAWLCLCVSQVSPEVEDGPPSPYSVGSVTDITSLRMLIL